MINADPVAPGNGPDGSDRAVGEILRSGAIGAVVLAGIATAIVVAIWFAFYVLVFLPAAASS